MTDIITQAELFAKDFNGKLEVPKMVVWIDKDIKVETTHLTDKTINELLALISQKLPEKMELTKDETNSDYFYGYGWNAAITQVLSILGEKP